MTMHDDDTDRREDVRQDPDTGLVDETSAPGDPEREPVAYPSGHEGFGYEAHEAADPVPESGPPMTDPVDRAEPDEATPVADESSLDREDTGLDAPTGDTHTDTDVTSGATGLDADDIRNRWREVQVAFVDDPRQAAGDARVLVGQVVEQVVAGLNRGVDDVNDTWSGDEIDTEGLRVALRGYRDLLDRLLAV